MTDKELISAGKQAVGVIERAQLRLGMLALQYAPIGEGSVKTGAYERLREYAEAIGVDEGTLRNYRAVAAGWKGIDTEGFGFTVLKATLPVAKKEKLLPLLRDTDPPTKSGRWTVPAAVEFAREQGLWSHAPAPRASDSVMAALRSTRASLAKLAELDLSEEETADVLTLIEEVRLELEQLQESIAQKTTTEEAKA